MNCWTGEKGKFYSCVRKMGAKLTLNHINSYGSLNLTYEGGLVLEKIGKWSIRAVNCQRVDLGWGWRCNYLCSQPT